MSHQESTLIPLLPSRQLEIAGQQYLLSITPQTDLAQNTWRFQLQNKRKGGLIPGGFKLRLLTEAGESFPGNEAVATEAMETLSLNININPASGMGLILKIEPLPEEQQEVLMF